MQGESEEGREEGEGNVVETNLVTRRADHNMNHEWVDRVSGTRAVINNRQLLEMLQHKHVSET